MTAQSPASRPGPAPGGRASVSGYGLHIFPQHAALLEASAVSPEVARQRGYVSVDTKRRLDPAGFARSQRSVPGLLIPLHGTDGRVRLHQYRPDSPRLNGKGKPRRYETPWRARLCLDVPPAVRGQLGDPAVPLWITEGARKADAAVSAGLCCIALLGVDGWRGTNGAGGRTALPDWADVALNGRQVSVCFDSDVMTKASVHRALAAFTGWLESRGAEVQHVTLPAGPDGAKTGLDDYLAAGHSTSELTALAHGPVQGSAVSGTPLAQPVPGVTIAKSGEVPAPVTLIQAEQVFSRWLHGHDRVVTRAVLAAYVANMDLPGDPVWLMLVGGSGAGKTERLLPVTGMPGVVMASAVTGEAALLSATPARERAANATGGLLRQVGERGLLVVKDFTSVLSMSRDSRAAVLAALREVFDGRWDRPYGADGGQVLTWQGHCGLLAGCTTAIDSAHSVLDKMGNRWVLVRLADADRDALSGAALDHMGREDDMRRELRGAVAGLLCNLPGEPHPVDGHVRPALIALASLARLARSPVQRDWRGEVDLVLDAEAPTRIIKQLGQLWQACGRLGLDRAASWEVVRRAGLDSVPKLRGAVLRYLAAAGEPRTTTQVADGVVHPSRTTVRALEELAAHHVVTRIAAGQGNAHQWVLSDQARGWYAAADTSPDLAIVTPAGEQQ